MLKIHQDLKDEIFFFGYACNSDRNVALRGTQAREGAHLNWHFEGYCPYEKGAY